MTISWCVRERERMRVARIFSQFNLENKAKLKERLKNRKREGERERDRQTDRQTDRKKRKSPK